MQTEQEGSLNALFNNKTDKSNQPVAENENVIMQFYNNQVLSAENNDNEITNNDGSIKETLDTAFHSQPGYIHEHSLAGSNRADFYEARSQGKSDTEEEQDYMRTHQQE